MADRAEEQLLGYLLAALDDSEQEQLEEQLANDPASRQRLTQWHKALRPLESIRTPVEPPAGLAERTCRLVAQMSSMPPEVPTADLLKELPSPLTDLRSVPVSRAGADVVGPPSWVGSWGWKDLAAAASILVAATLLLLPAIENSRSGTQLAACQNNLRLLGQALGQYSYRHGDYFPPVPQQGQLAAAGVFAPVLASTGDLGSPEWVVCPASDLAEDRQFRVPSLEELSAVDDPVRLERVRSRMGGSYGYCLGFMENGRYQGPRNLRRPFFALMSDTPSEQLPGHQSLNHGGRGQNVLFEDFHVQFFTTPEPDGLKDRFFVNDNGQVAVGRHRNDSVVAGSGSPPLRYVGLRGQ